MNTSKTKFSALRKLKISLAVLGSLLISEAYPDLKPPVIKKGKGPVKERPMESMPIKANFHFFASTYSPDVPDGSFTMKGTFNEKTRELRLKGVSWVKRPANYELVNLNGKINPEGTSFTGRVDFEGCKEFVLKRTSRNGDSPMAGKWEGSYICAQGVTGLTLTLE